MISRTFSYPLLAALLALNVISKAIADPWVDTSNGFLRENIEYLADINVITTPTTTFPLMWHDIANDLSNTPLHLLDETALSAYSYVRHQLKLAKRNQKRISVNAATDDNQFTSFGDSFRDANNLNIQTTLMFDRVAMKISANYNTSPNDGDYKRFDGSYLAGYWGNWVVSLGMQDRWWGPGWDTSLSLTNNARPIPALAISRKSAEPFVVPFTDYGIPWTVTSFMGQMDDSRVVKDTLLWGFRLNFKPINSVEIGVTRLAQWAGKNRPNELDTFWQVLKGQDNCGGNGPTVEECLAGKEPGNQMAGYDIRWSTQVLTHPVALYFTAFAEDGDRKGGLSVLGEERYQGGIDTRLDILNRNWRLFAEWTDTYATCLDGNNGDGTSLIGDCYYEHKIYQTGMRYKGRNLGNLYENDATSWVVGAISQVKNDLSFQVKLRWLALNQDNSDKAPKYLTDSDGELVFNPKSNNVGNTLTKVAKDMVMLSGKAQYSYRNWRFTLGGNISKSSYTNDIENDNDVSVFINIEHNLN